jgi:hypothetical protein
VYTGCVHQNASLCGPNTVAADQAATGTDRLIRFLFG